MSDRTAARRQKIQRRLRREGLDGFLGTNFTNVSYLSGFSGDDSYLLLGRTAGVLISDGRYADQIAEECPGLAADIRPRTQTIVQAVARVARAMKLGRIAFESTELTVAQYATLQKELPRVEWRPWEGRVEELRQIKDREEVAAIRQAITYAEKAFAMLRAGLRPEDSEKETADALEHYLRRAGAVAASFPPIIAAGERAALPHAQPTAKQLDEADFVLVDWGASGRFYKSDLTRLLVTRKLSPKLEKIYGLVLKAQEHAIHQVRPGIRASHLDAEARSVIAAAGFGRSFHHSLGHGLGLQVHEAPGLRTTSETVLAPGMVVTIEPGIYLSGWGGVRIEDDVLVTRDGCEVLTRIPKDLDSAIVT